jgi:hypothetical protein
MSTGRPDWAQPAPLTAGKEPGWLQLSARGPRPDRCFVLELMESVLLQRAEPLHRLPALAAVLRNKAGRRVRPDAKPRTRTAAGHASCRAWAPPRVRGQPRIKGAA